MFWSVPSTFIDNKLFLQVYEIEDETARLLDILALELKCAVNLKHRLFQLVRGKLHEFVHQCHIDTMAIVK